MGVSQRQQRRFGRVCNGRGIVLNLFGSFVVVIVAVACTSTSTAATEDPQPTMVPASESWLILPEMPSTATQADIGAEVYRLVCQDCHGDRGQGLTDEWRATWAPEDQNCWQSKCHASNHPPEGFVLPRTVPAIMGPKSLARFETTLDLFDYIKSKMPWHDPGNLVDAEYWQIMTFLARERGLDLGDIPFSEDAMSNQPLH